MMEKLKTFLSIIVIVICLPYLITFVVQGDFLNSEETEEGDAQKQDEDTGKLVLLLANEMPVSFEKEALKAQAVIARTNVAYAVENDQAEPEGVSWEDMREKLGAKDFQKYYDLLKSCVEETAGQTITRKGKAVQLPYHYVSAGKTRDAPKVDGKNTMPYLKSVSCANDLRCGQFLKIEFYSLKQFRNKLEAAYPELEFPDKGADRMAVVEKRDTASYVLSVALPGKKVSGEEFGKVFSLHSPCFSMKEIDGQVRIVTKGYGQGYGLSQYGANEMAKEGSSYQEILDYFYSGVTVTES